MNWRSKNMSGGFFDYNQYKISEIRDRLERVLNNSVSEDDDNFREDGYNLSPKIIREFETAMFYLEVSELYVQRIDWLLSGDDGEEQFFKRLTEEVGELMPKYKNIFKTFKV